MTTAAALLAEELALEERLILAHARKGLLSFTTYSMPEFKINWHHAVIARLINFQFAGKTAREFLATLGIHGRRLTEMLDNPHPVTKLYAGLTHPDAIDLPIQNVQVNVCPRHTKSELVSRRTPAWALGNNPNLKIIAVGCAATLTEAINRDVQRIIDDPAYKALFPNTALYGKNVRSAAKGVYIRNSEMFEIMEYGGVYKNAGVGGNIIGRGANALLMDDLFASRQDANSPTIRAKTWEWYESDALTRLEGRALQLLINQRWHMDDVSGRIQQKAASNRKSKQWMVLTFPALLDCEPTPGDPRKLGEALWPWRKTREQHEQERDTVQSAVWESMWQQRPSPADGFIKSEWWRFYDVLPEKLRNWTISVDLSFKDRGDFTAIQTWACHGANRYLIDQTLRRMTFTEQIHAFSAMCAKYPQVTVKLVEEAANGAALIDTLKGRIQGIVAVRPKGSKELRLDAVSPQIEAGNVYLPSERLAPWIRAYLDEFRAFPNGAHDDMIDATSQFLSRMAQARDLGALGVPVFNATAMGITKM